MITTWDIAKAVKAELEEADLSVVPGTLQASFLPRFRLEDITDLHITVLPAGVDLQPATRSMDQQTHRVQVGIHQRVDPLDAADAEHLEEIRGSLLDFTHEVVSHMRARKLQLVPNAQYGGASITIPYEPTMLQQNVFQSVIEFTYIMVA